MKNISIKIMAFALATMIIPQLSHAATSDVTITMSGQVAKEVHISSDVSDKDLTNHLEAMWEEDGDLVKGSTVLANIQGGANNNDGYVVRAESDFELADGSYKIPFKLKLGDNAEIDENGELMSKAAGADNIAANSFAEDLTITTLGVKDFLASGEQFTGSVKLTITAN